MYMYVAYVNICLWMQASRLEHLKGPAIAFCLIPLGQSLIKPYTGLAANKTQHTNPQISTMLGLWVQMETLALYVGSGI